MHILLYLLIGLLAGLVGGFCGLGGGIVLIPVLVYIFGLTQHQAQGTALAIMVPPITLLAALRYYYEGNVKLFMAAFVCTGFFMGGLLGAHFAQIIPDILLKKLFGCILLFVAIKMIMGR